MLSDAKAMQQAESDRRTVQPGDRIPYERAYAYRQPIPEDLWIKCPECGGVMFRDEFEENNSVCTFCKFHFRINVWARIELVTDANSFQEFDVEMRTLNPLQHEGYEAKIRTLQQKTGLTEGIITGVATIQGHKVVIGAMDSRFMMGSMGSVVGEKVTRSFEYATEHRLPIILFTASGGARMQAGILSLMQMTKTAAAAGRHHDAGLLYISVMTDPTTGGVTASFASLGDIIIAEPGTLIGFAGRRVIEGTISEKLPEDFQRAEFLLDHGFLDLIVQRNELRNILGELLLLHSPMTDSDSINAVKDLQCSRWHIGMTAEQRAKIAAEITASDQVPVVRSGSECLNIIRAKDRPNIECYLDVIFDASLELHGDRLFADDPAIWAGLAILDGKPVTVIGHHKGMDFQENNRTNFAMAHPEGYRKMMRLVEQAEKFDRPIVYLIDTPGAYCGVGAEERGVGEAIARCLRDCMTVKVPVVSVVIGEGGSGGALALSVCDRLGMLSNGIFSVISPRGFASLLWKDASREMEAADVARITAADLKELGICDEIIPEPGEGAHAEPLKTGLGIKAFVEKALAEVAQIDLAERLEQRYNKFRRIGVFASGDELDA